MILDQEYLLPEAGANLLRKNEWHPKKENPESNKIKGVNLDQSNIFGWAHCRRCAPKITLQGTYINQSKPNKQKYRSKQGGKNLNAFTKKKNTKISHKWLNNFFCTMIWWTKNLPYVLKVGLILCLCRTNLHNICNHTKLSHHVAYLLDATSSNGRQNNTK